MLTVKTMTLSLFVGTLAMLQTVVCEFILEYRLDAFDNKHGFLASGKCCDLIPFFGCGAKLSACDYTFTVCIDALDSGSGTTFCDGRIPFDTPSDVNSVIFGNSLGLTGEYRNPITVRYSEWKGGAKIKVRVEDRDIGFDDLVGQFTGNFRLATVPRNDQTSSWSNFVLGSDDIRLRGKIRVYRTDPTVPAASPLPTSSSTSRGPLTTTSSTSRAAPTSSSSAPRASTTTSSSTSRAPPTTSSTTSLSPPKTRSSTSRAPPTTSSSSSRAPPTTSSTSRTAPTTSSSSSGAPLTTSSTSRTAPTSSSSTSRAPRTTTSSTSRVPRTTTSSTSHPPPTTKRFTTPYSKRDGEATNADVYFAFHGRTLFNRGHRLENGNCCDDHPIRSGDNTCDYPCEYNIDLCMTALKDDQSEICHAERIWKMTQYDLGPFGDMDFLVNYTFFKHETRWTGRVKVRIVLDAIARGRYYRVGILTEIFEIPHVSFFENEDPFDISNGHLRLKGNIQVRRLDGWTRRPWRDTSKPSSDEEGLSVGAWVGIGIGIYVGLVALIGSAITLGCVEEGKRGKAAWIVVMVAFGPITLILFCCPDHC